jgi:hypothetical protein
MREEGEEKIAWNLSLLAPNINQRKQKGVCPICLTN